MLITILSKKYLICIKRIDNLFLANTNWNFQIMISILFASVESITICLLNSKPFTSQDPFVAIVIDPVRTISAGKVNLGAFRTYPKGEHSLGDIL